MKRRRSSSSSSSSSSSPSSSSLPLQMANRSGKNHTRVLFDLISQLPIEMKSNILSHLPIELLMKLRCFGKAFRRLIDAPSLRNHSTDRIILASTTASHSVTTPVSFLMLVQFNEQYDCEFHFADYHDTGNNEYYKVTRPIMYPHLNSRETAHGHMIVGSCNGLVCYAEHRRIKFDHIHIFNPVTREHLSLPPLRFQSERATVENGFGYIPVTKEYKVVRIYFDNQKRAVGEVEVYTLGTGEWRSISKVPSNYTIFENFPGVLVDGALHWYDRDGHIVSFDLTAETFDLVPSPSSVTLIPDGRSCYSLCALEERLCVVNHFEDTRLHIWVLNEDQSWTMDFSVQIEKDPPLCSGDKSLGCDTCTPITLTKSGKLLLWYNYKIFASYDIINEEQMLYGEYKKGHLNEIIPHVKSFVSLKDLGEDSEIMEVRKLYFLTLIQTDEEKHGRFYLTEYDDVTNEYIVIQPVTHPLLNLRNEGADNIIIGSCKGLVCYVDHRGIKFDSICVFNPVTSELVNLTPLGYVSKLYSSVVNGFGYDPVTKEYKVVRIYYDAEKGSGGEVEVYTLGTGEWRSVGKVPPLLFNAFQDFPGVLVNGVLHWIDFKGSIASFDLATETFQEVPSPSSLTLVSDDSVGNRYNLCALRDHLCVIHHFKDLRINIWELYFNQSWKMEFSFAVKVDPPLCANDESLECDFCTPLAFTRSGKLLLWYNYKMLASYDRNNEEKILYGEYKEGHFNEIVPHVKSFVSLEDLGENAKIIRI